MKSSSLKTKFTIPVTESAYFEKKAVLPESLRNFDSLPDAAYVRAPVVMGLYACSAATLWRNVQKGIIPKPKKLSERVTAWSVASLRVALNGSQA